MSHPIERALERVESKLRVKTVLIAVSLTSAWLIVQLALVGWLDSRLQIESGLLRGLAFGSLLLSFLLAFTFLLYPAIFGRKSRLNLALRIESQYPQLKDRLTSSLTFLNQVRSVRSAASVNGLPVKGGPASGGPVSTSAPH